MGSQKHTDEFEIHQPATALFPLFSPEGEKDWVPGWDYVNVMGTTDLFEDYVFLTHTHDHAGAAAIWIVKRYEPENYLVEYYRIEPGDKVGVVIVRCYEKGQASTRVEVSYEYFPIGPSGHQFMKTFTDESFAGFIGEWKALLEKHFG